MIGDSEVCRRERGSVGIPQWEIEEVKGAERLESSERDIRAYVGREEIEEIAQRLKVKGSKNGACSRP